MSVSDEQWWALQEQFMRVVALNQKAIELNDKLLRQVAERNQEVARLRELVKQ